VKNSTGVSIAFWSDDASTPVSQNRISKGPKGSVRHVTTPVSRHAALLAPLLSTENVELVAVSVLLSSIRMRVFALTAIAVALFVAVHANIISVDVGSDSMKIALVKPGLPFHIVTNLQSKRKVRKLAVRLPTDWRNRQDRHVVPETSPECPRLVLACDP
jgi:hypothetical protein